MTWLILVLLSDDLSGMYLYAGDAKLFSNNSVDLQHALDKFSDWLHNRQLILLHPNVNIYALRIYLIISAHFMWILIILRPSLLLKI